MPTYTYKREDGTTFEAVQAITADPLTKCPDTGQKVKRIFTPEHSATLNFRGQGWYTPPKVK